MVRMNVLMRVVLRTSVGLSESHARTQQSISSKAQFQSIMSEARSHGQFQARVVRRCRDGLSLLFFGELRRVEQIGKKNGTARGPAVTGEVARREVVLE